jgi:thiol-disulfide isomerase/thioredoxin
MDRTMKLTSFCAAAAMVSVFTAPAQAKGPPTVGAPAPEVVAAQLDGGTFDLEKLKGHVIVVNFWATWCPPCRAEMPVMDAFYRKHHGEGLVMIGLSEDKPRELPQVKNIMAAFAYPAAMTDSAKVNKFGMFQVLPQTYIIDRQGRIRATFGASGKPLTEAELNASVLPLLKAR